MIRILNFFCVALMGLSILALYHVSEQTRVAQIELAGSIARSPQKHATISVLETEWERVAGPARIQELAASQLGMTDTPAVQLSSFEPLPRRGDDGAAEQQPDRTAPARRCRQTSRRAARRGL